MNSLNLTKHDTWPLLLEILLRPNPDAAPPVAGIVRRDQLRILEFARNQGLLPLVYRNLKTWGLTEQLEPATEQELSSAYKHTLALNMELLTCLDEIEKMAQREHIDLICLKGAALICSIYRDPGIRPMDDIDLMVKRQDLDRLKRSMNHMGYRSVRSYPNLCQRGRVVFDLHTDPLNQARIPGRGRAIRIDICDLWSNSVPVPEHPHLKMLSRIDQVITLSVHAMKHGFQQATWLIDIAEVLAGITEARGYNHLAGKLKKTGTMDTLGLCLYMIKVRLYRESSIPFSNLPELSRHGLFLRWILPVATTPGMPQLIEPLLMVKNSPGWGYRTRYIVEAMFPGRAPGQHSGLEGGSTPGESYPRRMLQIVRMALKYLSHIWHRHQETEPMAKIRS